MSTNEITGRMRKLLIRDTAGNELRVETDDDATLAELERIYRGSARTGRDMLFADAGSRRILGDKQSRVGELFPGLGNIEIIALEDTVNA